MVIKVFKVVCKGEGRIRGSVKRKVKQGGEMKGETRDIVRKNMGGVKQAERNIL